MTDLKELKDTLEITADPKLFGQILRAADTVDEDIRLGKLHSFEETFGEDKEEAMTDTQIPIATKVHHWIGPDGARYSANPICQAPEKDCPGVCIYCLEFGTVDESLREEVKP